VARKTGLEELWSPWELPSALPESSRHPGDTDPQDGQPRAESWLRDRSAHSICSDAIKIGEGSLYLALQRLMTDDYLEAVWGVSENNRRARRSQRAAKFPPRRGPI